MPGHIITEAYSDTYLIRPDHINTDYHFCGAFGNNEKEVSARWIVLFCQKHDTWKPFTDEEIGNFYRSFGKGFVTFSFGGLLGEYVVKKSDGKYYLTHQFICNCFKVSPALSAFIEARSRVEVS